MTNFQKSMIVPIRCQGLPLDDILSCFPARRATFPIRYLGLPLTPTRLRKRHFQFLVDKVLNKLSSWNGRNFSVAGRLTLVKTVLTSEPIYLLTALNAPKATISLLDSKRRQFLWAGSERLTGGKCKVNWKRVARPKALGGLGVLDLGAFARALRVRWLWHNCTSSRNIWDNLEIPCSDADRLLFAASTTIEIGDGSKISFWGSAWVRGQRPKDLAPRLFSISRNKRKSLAEAVTNNAWIMDLALFDRPITPHHIHELCILWCEVQKILFHPERDDAITWNFTADHRYTVKSAYQAQFLGSVRTNYDLIIWKNWVPPKCKFFQLVSEREIGLHLFLIDFGG
jgi:hypothetical protein